MNLSRKDSDHVLQDLPLGIRGTLQPGYHGAKPQLFVVYHTREERYRLVVSDVTMEALKPKAGQEWLLHPQYTPNGRIIFCSLSTVEQAEEIRVRYAREQCFPEPEKVTWVEIIESAIELRNEPGGQERYRQVYSAASKYDINQHA